MNGSVLKGVPRTPDERWAKAARFVTWAFSTAVWAYLMPFFAVGLVIALAHLLGAGTREWVTLLAVNDPRQWTSGAQNWHWFCVVVWVGTVGVRIVMSGPYSRLMNRLSALIDRKCAELGLLVRTSRPAMALRRLDAKRLNAVVGVIVGAMVFSLAGFLMLSHGKMQARPPAQLPPLATVKVPKLEPVAAAAVALPDGSIVSGHVDVQRDASGNYVLSFKDAGAATKSEGR
ncbi:hypothetical protein Bphyt_7406 (plasmid) [Paraburkholderia phytofirmans PsJN]|uniref:Transmembrane protein n=1 Tax=Paraburkholderia phytofirmans (strain DSM 17436 / LMG 22146 / PsJN) TaxID=398527 RepID=B2TGX5_PARPJ|nr:hypothetical protein Bphyt_7406 [Paraburkholderia phytofirmans PsJN]